MLNVVPEEERAHGTISNKTYLRYVQEGGNTMLTILLVFVFIIAEVIMLLHNYHFCKIQLNVLLLG